MRRNPFAGDVARLQGQSTFRRRVGNWRIFFDAYPRVHTLEVTDVLRRTTTTYRKRHWLWTNSHLCGTNPRMTRIPVFLAAAVALVAS